MSKIIKNVSLGIAPINWTNDDMPDLGSQNTFEQCISEMALAGYTGCEVGTKFPINEREQLKHMLEIRGLQICNQWHSLFLTSKSLDDNIKAFKERCEFLRVMGAQIIGVSEQTNSIQGKLAIPLFSENKPIFTNDDWKVFSEGINELGKIAMEEYGVNLTYHYHLGTSIENKVEIDRFIQETDERYVSLIFDSGHIFCCGEEPLSILKQYKSRVKHIHLKDVRTNVLKKAQSYNLSFLDAVREGLFTVPSDGDIDFKPIFDELFSDTFSYEGWMVVEAEQDPQKANAFEYAQKARNYIKDVLHI